MRVDRRAPSGRLLYRGHSSPQPAVALTVGGYSALGATMGAFFLGAAAILAHDPAWRRAATEQDPALARARALPVPSRARG
jgi:hypothetical protein